MKVNKGWRKENVEEEEEEIVLYYIVLIHFYSVSHSTSLSEAPPTTAVDTGLHAKALQATVSEWPAQGPYVAARAEFEPATLGSKGIDSTNAPSRTTMVALCDLRKRAEDGKE